VTAFRLSNKAIEDLKSIGRYTQQTWGLEQRKKYLAKIDAGFHTIAREPRIGTACDNIRKGYRKFYVGRNLVFYRQTGNRVEIIRILHDRMDVKSHMSEH
jgi:toxin ParE1/3/4